MSILEATRQILDSPKPRVPSMSEVAKAAGISRQAVYLHFASRAEVLIAAIRYIDERQGLPARLARIYESQNSTQMLDRCVEVWGGYLPEIRGIAHVLLQLRDSDSEVLEAWNETVRCLKDVCRDCIKALKTEGRLAEAWTLPLATDMLTGMLSRPCWDELRRLGWNNQQYIKNMKLATQKTFCKDF